MNDRLARNGWHLGWTDAARYATGAKADRREIRNRLAKATICDWSAFWTAYLSVFVQRVEDFGHAIEQGRSPRTIRPTRLYALVNR